MPQVFIPPLLRQLTHGAAEVRVDARTVADAVDELERQFPGVRERLLVDGELMPGMAVSVDGRISSLGLLQRVEPESELHFLPAIGGG
jgi:sulfur-carrier protein